MTLFLVEYSLITFKIGMSSFGPEVERSYFFLFLFFLISDF